MENLDFHIKQESIDMQKLDWEFKPNCDHRIDTHKFSANEWDIKNNNNFGSSKLELTSSDWTFIKESNPSQELQTDIKNNDWFFQSQNFPESKTKNDNRKENLIRSDKIKEEIENKINKYKKLIDFSIYFRNTNLIADAKFFDDLQYNLIQNNLKEKAMLVKEQGNVILNIFVFILCI